MIQQYYKILLRHKIKGIMLVALTKAEDIFDAERKGKEYNKKWESQGFEYRSADFISDDISRLEQGETIFLG